MAIFSWKTWVNLVFKIQNFDWTKTVGVKAVKLGLYGNQRRKIYDVIETGSNLLQRGWCTFSTRMVSKPAKLMVPVELCIWSRVDDSSPQITNIKGKEDNAPHLSSLKSSQKSQSSSEARRKPWNSWHQRCWAARITTMPLRWRRPSGDVLWYLQISWEIPWFSRWLKRRQGEMASASF